MRCRFRALFHRQLFTLVYLIILTVFSRQISCNHNENPAGSVTDQPLFKVEIEKHTNALQGHYSPVDIRLYSGQDRITGFSLLIVYDTTQLRLRLAEPGGFLKGHGWADFSVESLAVKQGDSLSNLCFLRITGSIGDGVTPDTAQRSSNGLAHFIFFVKNERPLECQLLPVRFFWRTCEDNVILARAGKTPYYARSIIDSKIPWEDMYDLPGDCFLDIRKTPPIPRPCQNPNIYIERQSVDYVNGGIDVVCTDAGSGIAGDIDLNGLSVQPSDISALARLLIYGHFCPYLSDSIQYVTQQVYKSRFDVGRLSISSLIYMNRIIIGDMPLDIGAGDDSIAITAPFSKDSLVLSTRSSAQLGALMLTFTCNDDLTLPVTADTAFGARVCYAANAGRLCLLVYWPDKVPLADGKQMLGTMRLPGLKRLVEAEAVDYCGRPVKTIIKKRL
ncbi:MAG: hypothetical protein PHR28_10185 [candidate division Zixibacteria bacterium]|nr:hypothetical protein [candidate division Zixibacteria bacterium]